MAEVNEEKQLVRRLPAQTQVDEWVTQFKKITTSDPLINLNTLFKFTCSIISILEYSNWS